MTIANPESLDHLDITDAQLDAAHLCVGEDGWAVVLGRWPDTIYLRGFADAFAATQWCIMTLHVDPNSHLPGRNRMMPPQRVMEEERQYVDLPMFADA